MTTLHGRNALVYLQGSGATAQVLSEASEWQISIDSETADDGAFGDSWVTNLKGRMKFSGSLNGNYDTASNLAYDASVATTARAFYLYPDASDMTKYYYGTIFPKLSVTVSLTTVAKFTASFDGSGPLSRS